MHDNRQSDIMSKEYNDGVEISTYKSVELKYKNTCSYIIFFFNF